MPNVLRLSLVAIVLLVLPATAGAAAKVSYQPSTEQQVLLLLNQIRQRNGLGMLALSAPLRNAARAHSADMLRQSYFDHNSPNESWDTRLSRYVKSSAIGETVAWGRGANGSPAGIVSQWMRSAVHRRTILASDLHRVGIGLARGMFDGVPSAVVATADFAG